jgi:hypothetical protein
MFFKFKILIYYIKGGLFNILKAPLNYYFNIFIINISLYYLKVLFLS